MDYKGKICGCDSVMHQWASPTCFSCFYMCENDWSLTMPVHGFLFASDTGITPAVKPMAPVGKILRTTSFSSSTLFTRLRHLWVFFFALRWFLHFQALHILRQQFMQLSFGSVALVGGIILKQPCFFIFLFKILVSIYEIKPVSVSQFKARIGHFPQCRSMSMYNKVMMFLMFSSTAFSHST